jgi:hypothetical protein
MAKAEGPSAAPVSWASSFRGFERLCFPWRQLATGRDVFARSDPLMSRVSIVIAEEVTFVPRGALRVFGDKGQPYTIIGSKADLESLIPGLSGPAGTDLSVEVKVRTSVFRRSLGITEERHIAFNWLLGFEPIYSQVPADT